MNIYDFIRHTKENPLRYINYCEVIITSTGEVIIVNPCHAITAREYVMKKYNKTKEEILSEVPEFCYDLEYLIETYNLVAVWYSGYLHPSKGLNRFQKHTINQLLENGLITNTDPFIQSTTNFSKNDLCI